VLVAFCACGRFGFDEHGAQPDDSRSRRRRDDTGVLCDRGVRQSRHELLPTIGRSAPLLPAIGRSGLARDPSCASWIGGLAVRAIGAWQRRIARARGLGAPLTGAVTFVQRFGGLVNLNVHFHIVVPDGVFVEDGDGLRLVMLPVPTNANVLAILDRIMRRVARRLANEAVDDDEDAAPDVLAQVQAEAATTWRSPTDGKPTVRGGPNGIESRAGWSTRRHSHVGPRIQKRLPKQPLRWWRLGGSNP